MTKQQSLERKIKIHGAINKYLDGHRVLAEIRNNEKDASKTIPFDAKTFYENLDVLYEIYSLADQIYSSGVLTKLELIQILKEKISDYLVTNKISAKIEDVSKYIDRHQV